MDALFSCRNCVQNCGQSLNVGNGVGYCLQHNSLIKNPQDTTCKYLHRKDLPRCVVEEGIKEHAAEYVTFPGLVSLSSKRAVPMSWFSEKQGWLHGSVDPIVLVSAQYHRMDRAWVLIEAFVSGIDGRRSLAHSSLVRRYMDHCGTWMSSYRLVLTVIQEIDVRPQFATPDLVVGPGDKSEDVAFDALWDVFFTRLAAVQEYGWHSGLEELLWATDSLNGSLIDLDWEGLQQQLAKKKPVWTRHIIQHAKRNGGFFPAAETTSPESQERRV
ncbi:MAG: hypothetical protein BIFFINMI_00576 [Phycisphaerae bacterium]|nr:hypothetical protein [Phycisphaerae bacterium]